MWLSFSGVWSTFGIDLIKDFLIDVRIILILPDREHLTVIKGHTLSPSYTSYVDSNTTDVAAVLNKMISSLNTKKNEGARIPHDLNKSRKYLKPAMTEMDDDGA